MDGFYAPIANARKPSFLAARTIKSRTTGLDDPLDRSVAARRRARRALTIIDAKTMLEITQRAIRLSVIAQGGAAGGKRLLQYGLYRCWQARERRCRLSIRAHKRCAGAFRRDAGAIERLTNINIAQPRDQPLIEQQGFHRRLAAGKSVCKEAGVKHRIKRLNAKITKMWIGVERGDRQQQHKAEASRIIVNDGAAMIEMQYDMIMRRIFIARAMKDARRFPINTK